MAYRINVLSGEAAANGTVTFDVMVERGSDATSWTQVQNGHRTVVFTAAELLAIANGPGNAAAKKAAVSALFKAQIAAWGLTESDDAATKVLAVLNLPQVIALP